MSPPSGGTRLTAWSDAAVHDRLVASERYMVITTVAACLAAAKIGEEALAKKQISLLLQQSRLQQSPRMLRRWPRRCKCSEMSPSSSSTWRS